MVGNATGKVLIAAGGTGGHIIPAQIMAKYFSARGHPVVCVGTDGAMERKLLSDFELHTLHVTGLRGKSSWDSLRGVFRMAVAFVQSIKLLRQLKPRVVLCMGGYVTVPVALAARLLRIPVVLHEQNSIVGLSNHYLARFAKTVLSAFPDVFAETVKAQTVGNPLRAEMMTARVDKTHRSLEQPIRLLILGGSQGAQAINSCCMDVFSDKKQTAHFSCWHQTGERDFARVSDFYKQHQSDIKYSAFIDDMAQAYAWADVVISRAGALSVAELSAAGLPVLFVPFPFAVDDHQYTNAMMLVTRGAAYVCREKEFTPALLSDYLNKWQQDRAVLQQMGEKAYECSIGDADSKIYHACIAACGEKENIYADSR